MNADTHMRHVIGADGRVSLEGSATGACSR